MAIEAVFTEDGSLGLAFEAASPNEPPKIKEVKAGTQAVQHGQLAVGMKLVEVGGTSCESLAYKQCIDMIKAHPQRPISLKFERKAPHPSAEALLEAGEEGWTEDIVSIMDSGLVYIDRADEFTGNSALLNAAVMGHIATVEECLRREAQVDLKCAMDQTALVKAAGMGHLDIVNILLDKRAVRCAPIPGALLQPSLRERCPPARASHPCSIVARSAHCGSSCSACCSHRVSPWLWIVAGCKLGRSSRHERISLRVRTRAS